MATSQYFKRFKRDCKHISSHIKFKRIKFGFYRLYWINGGEPAYLHEACENMPYIGYDIEEKNAQLTSQKYYEEFEDHAELIMKIKNYREGYWDALDRIKTRVYMLKNDKEFREEATRAYRTRIVK